MQRPFGRYYVLRGHDVVETNDPLEAALCMENMAARTVRKTPFVANDGQTECEVSTVFLSIDHNYTDHGPPIVFETLVFGGPMDDSMRRYATWAEAEAGHDEVVELVRKAMRGEKPADDDEVALKFERRTWHERVLADDD